MKRLFSIALLLSLVVPSETQAASGSMSTPMMGVGPHGFDYLIGSWSCINSIPSNIGGPATRSGRPRETPPELSRYA